MNRSRELSMIDYSILTTMGKGGDYACYENVVGALEDFVFKNSAKGFTRKDDARNYISSLNKDEIRRELIKNIIKKHYCTIYNGYATILKTNKKFDDNLNISESELLIFDAVNEMQIESIDNILDKLPKLTELMIESFVDSRYFDRSYMVTNLDSNEVSNEECQNLLFKVDAYYSRKQEIINKENCGKSIS